MKQIELLWLSLLYVGLVKVSQVKGVGDTFGSQFLLYLPMYHNLTVKYDLSLFTLQQHNLKVYLTSHHSVQDLSSVIYVARIRPVLYSITPNLAEMKKLRTNTYLLKSSDGYFSLMVYVYFVSVSFESMTAIPVHIWEKKYNFNTIEMNPFVYVLTLQANEIRVTVIGDNSVKYMDFLQEGGRHLISFTVQLEEYGGTELFHSNKSDISCCDLLVVWIESKVSPIGVIVGSIIDDPNKRKKVKAKGGFTLEMLLPIGTLEYGYFTPDLVAGYCIRCTLSSAADDLAVFVSTFRNVNTAWQFELSDKQMTPMEIMVEWLYQLPTQATYTINQITRIDYETESYSANVSAMSVIIPSTLYATFYFWCTVDIKDVPMTHYAVFVFMEEDDLKDGFEFDWQDISGALSLRSLQFGHLQITNGTAKCLSGKMIIPIGNHNCYSRKYTPFGLYLYGIADDYLYLHPAGFITSITRSKVQSLYSHLKILTYGLSNIEADRLGEQKEDLRFYPPQTVTWGEWYTWSCPHCETNQSLLYRKCKRIPRGLIYYEDYDCLLESKEDRNAFCSDTCPKNGTAAWSQWSEWECSPDCTDIKMIRTRYCGINNIKDKSVVCDGPSYEHKDGDCKSNCPEVTDCPAGKWGENCSQLCQFCDPGCRKIDGTCERCLPGYRYPHLGCNEVIDCPVGKWGENCSQLCRFCDPDCNKINGTCERCLPGYRYPHLGCNEVSNCPLGKWGKNCTQLCKFCDQGCGRLFGTCKRCLPGYRYPNLGCNEVIDCPAGKWGEDCSLLCQYCDPDCSKINGSCQSCLPGYRYPHLGCNEACGKYTYGHLCEGDCLTKCDGQDCLDREDGECPLIYRLPSRFWLLLLLIPVSLLIYLRLCHRDTETPEAKLTVDNAQNPNKTESKSSILSRLSVWSKTLLGDKSSQIYKYDEKYGTFI